MDVISWYNPHDGGYQAVDLCINLWIGPCDTECTIVLPMVQTPFQGDR